MGRFGVLLTVFLLLQAALASAPGVCRSGDDRMERLESEVEELKKENTELGRRLSDIESVEEDEKHFDGIQVGMVEISGYADAEYYLTDAEGENNRFRVR